MILCSGIPEIIYNQETLFQSLTTGSFDNSRRAYKERSYMLKNPGQILKILFDVPFGKNLVFEGGKLMSRRGI